MAPASSYCPYPSSIDPALTLYGRFYPTPEPAPVMVRMHGWHGNVQKGHEDNVIPAYAGRFCMVEPEMRGRGAGAGRPDANGLELQDAVDAIEGMRKLFPGSVDASAAPRLWGGSGGGGNVLGMVGKFPDLFAAAVCECGISDYALWFAHDSVGEFRDELDTAGWIGGTPETRPEAYLSRGGRTTAMNLLTPLLLIHGDSDPRVPVEQAQAYIDAAQRHGTSDRVRAVIFPGVGHPGHFGGLDEKGHERRKREIARQFEQFTRAPQLPGRGTMVVAGYLRTRRFAVQLESVDHVALLDYDLVRDTFRLIAPTSRRATLSRPGQPARTLPCEAISFSSLRSRPGVPESLM